MTYFYEKLFLIVHYTSETTMQMQQLHITRTIPTVKTVFGNRCAVDNQVMTRGNGIRQMNLRGNRPATMIKAVAQEPAAAIPSPSQGEVRP